MSVAELLEKAATVGSDADSARSLMNLVMQFRKVSVNWEALVILPLLMLARSATIPSYLNAPMLYLRSLSAFSASLDLSTGKEI